MKLIRLALMVVVTACAPDAVTAPAPMVETPSEAVLPTLPEMRIRDILAGRAIGVRTMSAAERAAGVRVKMVCVSPLPLARQPLFVVDGIPQTSGDFPAAGLQPTDIMHIEVVKGPVAVRMYGPSARNGAVLIRTRRG
jgi:hypothetical protein